MIASTRAKSARVEIFFGSPVDHGRQVLRPYEYRISETHLDELRDAGTRFLGNMRTLDGTDFSGVILPSSKSTDIRTSSFSDLYRFVMIVYRPRVIASNGHMGSREAVQTYTGYFYEEPFGVINGRVSSVNERAMLLITNSSDMLNITGESLQTRRDVDVAHAPLANESQKTLYRCDLTQLVPEVSDVGESSIYGGVTPNRPLNDPTLSGSLASVGRNSIKNQLGLLARGVQRCDTMADTRMVSHGGGVSRFKLYSDNDPHDVAIKNTFSESVVDRGAAVRTSGIDLSSKSMELRDVLDTFGRENVEVFPVPELVREWDVLDPSMCTAESQAAVVAAAAVRDLCGQFRLKSLGFVYASDKMLLQDTNFTPIGGFTVGDMANTSYFGLTSIEPWVNVDASLEVLQSHQAAIHMELDTRVAPILHSLGNGEDFVLMVENRGADRCLTRVKYAGVDYGYDEDTAYYEHHTRLAGLTSPIIGDHATVKSNTDAVGNVLKMVSANSQRLMQDYDEYSEMNEEPLDYRIEQVGGHEIAF